MERGLVLLFANCVTGFKSGVGHPRICLLHSIHLCQNNKQGFLVLSQGLQSYVLTEGLCKPCKP
jgi:hypothetical protein